MALQKSITLPNGAAGNYLRIGFMAVDHLTREASAHFVLHASAAQRESNPTAPLALIAKLRLAGAKFDAYLGTAALAAVDSDDPVRAQLYAAAKIEPLMAGGGLRNDQLDLSDATNA